MPYRTRWEEKGIVWEFSGHVTAKEILEANAEFYGNERSDSADYQIIDASSVESVEWSESAIAQTAAFDIGAERSIKKVKVAYVAVDEEIVSKMEKYIEISRRLNSTWQFEGFCDIGEARDWVRS